MKDASEKRAIRAGAVLAAAGTGERLGPGGGVPKALLALGGRPLVWHSLSVFEDHSRIEAVVLVVPPGMEDRFRREIADRWSFRKVSAVVRGGGTRQESVRLGLDALDERLDPVLIHDAARPLVTSDLVSVCLESGAAFGACIPALPVAGTVKQVDDGDNVRRTVDRTGLWEAQTPQVFGSSVIREAHRAALESGTEATDDSSLVEKLGVSVKVVRGSPENIKVTWPVDLEIAEAILNRRTS